jgi:predicted alpha/beta superfamily hydrolase
MEKEIAHISENAGDDFFLLAFKVDDWNLELSPWQAPAVFGKEDFGGGAGKTLKELLAELPSEAVAGPAREKKKYYIGGYSLAGLFALWAAYQTDLFTGVAAASPSIWFPGFVDYMKAGNINADRVYLSLGNREAKTRNPVMATVADCIEISFDLLRKQGVTSVLEWNEGNHFKDADIRTAKAFSWVLNRPGGCE